MPRFLAALVALMTASLAAHGQEAYPTRPITMIVPFAAGGTSDVIARVVAEEMSRVLGQRIITENAGGAGGTLALARAARAEPDGYTIAIGNTGTNAAAYSIYPELKYTPDAFAPIGLVAKTSPLLAIKKAHPARTLAEFIAFARANPGRVTLGHAGVGSSNYLICRNFIHAAKVEITLVSYRGAAPALYDLLAGQIDGVCDAATSLASNVLAGEVRALAVAAPTRLAGLPDVPTSTEAGLPAFQAQGWNALFAPKGTPEAVIQRLNAAIRQAVASEALQKRFAELASTTPGPDELAPAFVAQLVPAEIAKYRQLLANP
ncbi:tripartite tricarboxylate transporter substrate-binding protein [Phreatobacter stygius]|uniref:Tripartite tricarboxylate transporter substrate binding protein BugD n=1 Tax=Phreatobacter stygius TaxID=1940610 RepID=A0A4D7B206_9HYPH|nr:tripartite tricarboxylate transporter substrate-binding protein [Phreatobacter stygius]QCI63556.1 tripartite tricarboxylate transporter substrate binding protein BugD [Phreatobacter stygius]